MELLGFGDVKVEQAAEWQIDLGNLFEVEEVAETADLGNFGLSERKFGVLAEGGPI